MRALAIAAMIASAGAAVAADGDAATTAPDAPDSDPATTTELRPLPPIRSPDGGIAPPVEHPDSEGREAPVAGAQEGPGDWQLAVWKTLLEGVGNTQITDGREALLILAFPVVTSPAWVPYLAVERRSYRAEFNAIPYRGSDDGLLFLVSDAHPSGWRAMGRLGAEIGRAVDEHDWTWARAQALVDTTWRVGATASLTWFDHAPPPADGARTVVGTGDLLYRIAQNPSVQVRAGVGAVALIDDDIGAKGVGPDFAYAIDVFPERPLALTTTLDVGWVHGQRVAGADFSIGIVIPDTGLEAFAGWRWQHLDHDGVQGVVGGLRWWF